MFYVATELFCKNPSKAKSLIRQMTNLAKPGCILVIADVEGTWYLDAHMRWEQWISFGDGERDEEDGDFEEDDPGSRVIDLVDECVSTDFVKLRNSTE
ncbi:hypothetical protein HDU93_007434, partial [Gonapodya sp. JEL0774]